MHPSKLAVRASASPTVKTPRTVESDVVVRRRAHAGADTTAGRSRCSQAEEDLLRMPRYPQAAR